jgi:trehalose 6-phosphate synthase
MPDIARYLEDRTLILLSNREPYEHVAGPNGIEIRQPPGGLVSALDPTMQRTQGIWVAWGSGSADHETADAQGRLAVPPDDPTYSLRRVWLDADDIEGYYLGFANSALWPLCHMLIQHFRFRADHWTRYQNVNERFADAVASEVLRAPGRPVVWIQDYHFALVPELLRMNAPSLFIHQFWHIPFPPTDILHLLPTDVYQGVLRGLLGNDLVEFHTERYALNFLSCVADSIPEAAVDQEAMQVTLGGHTTRVGVFPISIDVQEYEGLALSPPSVARVAELRGRYATGGRQLGVSVDRIDYTKGIPERLRALELLWDESPELQGRFTFILVATPSRSDLAPYKALEDEVISTVAAINARYGSETWVPIVLINENVNAELLASIYRAADICLVSSLQDGMNLVAKEFIACQVDERGVLVLSRFTGAAEEIEGAVLINPFNVDGFAAGIRYALEMPLDERRQRMRQMREQLSRSTIFDWLEDILSQAASMLDEREKASR